MVQGRVPMQRGAAFFVGSYSMRQFVALVPLLLAACAAADEPDAPGGVTQSEAAALNDAATMLDGNSVDANTIVSESKDP